MTAHYRHLSLADRVEIEKLLEKDISKAQIARARLASIAEAHGGTVRGRGLIQGLAFEDSWIAQRASPVSIIRITRRWRG